MLTKNCLPLGLCGEDTQSRLIDRSTRVWWRLRHSRLEDNIVPLHVVYFADFLVAAVSFSPF
jgi:hypothetical protein